MDKKMAKPVLIPLLNPNETEVLLSELFVTEGQFILKGDTICNLETTKSTADLTAEANGYVRGLSLTKGSSARAGEVLCYLSSNPDWTPPSKIEAPTSLPEGLRITRPALNLARSLDLDLSSLPAGPLITEVMLQAYISPAAPDPAGAAHLSFPATDFDPTSIVIYGGGGHGKMVVDLLRARGAYRITGIIDDGLEPGSTVMGLPVLGGAKMLTGLASQGVHLAVNAVGGIGNIQVRITVFERLAEAGLVCPPITHPTAYIDPSASLEAGAQVMAMAYVGSEAIIGYGSIVNTGAIVSHDCRLESYSVISPGALLAGDVLVGEGSLIGMGATVNLGVKVGHGARIGNGATIKSDVPVGGVVRAGTVWPT